MVRDALYFPIDSFINVDTARGKRNKSNRATDSKRSNCKHTTYGEQPRRSEELVS
jgi:hypothetical protein